MKEMRMTKIACALVGLLVATTALAEVEAGAKTEKVEPAPSTTTLETRMEQLENSVAELTSRLRRLTAADEDSETNPSAEETTVTAAEYGALKIAVAELSRELSELKDLSEANEPETGEDESENDASEQGIIQSPAGVDLMSEAYYLPSRSWAGGKLHYGGEDFEMKIHGFVDLEYIDAGADGSRGGVAGFDSHHANLFFDTNLRSNLSGHVEVEFEHSGESIEIDQAFIKWAVADWPAFDVGRFYSPFGIERFTWYSPTNQLISRPEPLRQIIPGNFYANGIKSSGLLRRGDEPVFTYELSVSNGLGEKAAESRRSSRQVRDNNSNSALSGRVAVILWPKVEIGTSYHTQSYDAAGELGLRFVGFDLSARSNGFEIRTEYVSSSLELGPQTPDLEQSGWYTQLSYTFLSFERAFLPALTLVTRYDRVDLDALVEGNDDRKIWSLGVNFKIYEHFRIKTEYRFAREEGTPKDNDTFLTQFVVDF